IYDWLAQSAFHLDRSFWPARYLQDLLDTARNTGTKRFFELLPYLLIAGVMSSPVDYWNLRVADSIYGREFSSRFPIFALFLDVLVSVALPVGLLLTFLSTGWFADIHFMSFNFGDPETTYEWIMIVAVPTVLVVSMSAIFAFFAVRLTVFVCGIVCRILYFLSILNRRTVLVSRANEVPFTFIGALVAIACIIVG
ncbi:MAG: hypothetical protein AAFR02_04660, partial [Pseudomonadota bacterium]